MRKWNFSVGLMLGCLFSAHALSDDFADSALQLCEKLKGCAIAKMNQSDLTSDVRQMMEPMLATMCFTMQDSIQQVPSDHELYGPALACMRSMNEMSCEDMQNQKSYQTGSCITYEELARKYESVQ
jgi:hypothetical protein